MPGFDGTGPRGQGPRTGGGWGRCAPLPDETGVPRGMGRGGLPWGGGRGRCWGGGGPRGGARWARGGRWWLPAHWLGPQTETPERETPEEEKK